MTQELVLDLDSTLVHSSEDLDEYKKLSLNPTLKDRLYKIKFGNYEMWGVFRPYLRQFLDYIHQRFAKVHIWSAGLNDYVHSIVKTVYDNHGKSTDRPITIWSRKNCASKPYLHKPLANFFLGRSANPMNTFIVDDREETFAYNKGNGILIPAYEPGPNYREIMNNDVALLQLISWFSLPSVRRTTDVRVLPKADIFDVPLPAYHDLLLKLSMGG